MYKETCLSASEYKSLLNAQQRFIFSSQNDDRREGGEGALGPVAERRQVGEVDDAEEAELQVHLAALAAAAPQPLALEVGEGAEGGQRQQGEAQRVRGVPPAAPAVHLVQQRFPPGEGRETILAMLLNTFGWN